MIETDLIEEKYISWMKSMKKPLKDNVQKDYVEAIDKGSEWAIQVGLISENMYRVSDYEKFQDILDILTSYEGYVAYNSPGHGTFQAALHKYRAFLKQRVPENEGETDLRDEFTSWLRNYYSIYGNGTINSYAKALRTLVTQLDSIDKTYTNVFHYQTVEDFEKRNLEIRSASNFKKVNKENGNQVLSAALNSYGKFLKATESNWKVLQEEIIGVSDEDVKEITTMVGQYVSARRGQSLFRQRLKEREIHCQLCQIKIDSMMIASHIKPWAKANNQEKLDVDNGLWLCVLHDALFDRGLISFDDNGILIIADTVLKQGIDDYKLNVNMKIVLQGKMRQYMAYHRKKVYEQFDLHY